MIYYSNTSLHTPHVTFIGRWAPFHKGHIAIITKKIKEHPTSPVLICVRNTKEDQYTPSIRAVYIKSWMEKNHIKGTIMIIPNIQGIYYGRGVGYQVEEIDVDEKTKKISATTIRKSINGRKKKWKSSIAHSEDSYMLTPAISRIMEKGLVIWLTGCPSSGKTTIAQALLKELSIRFPQLQSQLLDGDIMRATPLAKNVGFESKDRTQHIVRMAYIAKMFADHGILTICAFVSPYRSMRAMAKRMIGKKRFIEVYIKASKNTRLERDVKGLYKKAIAGKIKRFTGHDAPYEPPREAHVVCDTDTLSIQQSVDILLTRINTLYNV